MLETMNLEGLWPKMPLKKEGMRMEPPMSEPMPKAEPAAPWRQPSPPEEPPTMWLVL